MTVQIYEQTSEISKVYFDISLRVQSIFAVTANIDECGSFYTKIDKCTPSSETSTEHLSEGIRIFLIASDKWLLLLSMHFLGSRN